jgi:hypothetical protein
MTVESMHVPSNTDMYYLMYYAYLQKPRIFKKEMCRYTGTALNTVYKHIKLAKKYDILFSPQLRLLATLKTNEFMYFVKVSDPVECLPILKEMGAFYVCLLSGYYNLMFMSYEPIDITHISLFSRVGISKWTERTSFLKLLSSLQHIGIIEDYETSLPFESQVFHPGSPLPAPSP